MMRRYCSAVGIRLINSSCADFKQTFDSFSSSFLSQTERKTSVLSPQLVRMTFQLSVRVLVVFQRSWSQVLEHLGLTVGVCSWPGASCARTFPERLSAAWALSSISGPVSHLHSCYTIETLLLRDPQLQK